MEMHNKENIIVRFIKPDDIPALLELEHTRWNDSQAASTNEMLERINKYPEFSVGAFAAETGKALASLFTRPAYSHAIEQAKNWYECVHSEEKGTNKKSYDALYGISLSSCDKNAIELIMIFLFPIVLKYGIKKCYLGTPIPGLTTWMDHNPHKTVTEYIFDKQRKIPQDPQLRYYQTLGFKQIVAIKPDFFPHDASLNYGVLICGKVPFFQLAYIFKMVPFTWLHKLAEMILPKPPGKTINSSCHLKANNHALPKICH